MKTKHRLLSLILAVAMVFSLSVSAMAAETPDMSGQLVILHTNDSHSRVNDNLGFATVAAAKTYYESLGADVLLLDAGDTLHGLPVANLTKGENIVEIMNAVGYDAMTPGNHDFNYGTDRLAELSALMDFPLLSANFTRSDGSLVFEGSAILEAGDLKVGVVGISTPETASKANPLYTAGYSFNPNDIAAKVQAQIDALSAEGVDYIIALGHLGIDEESAPWRSTDVIAQVTGLDAFIDGHSHSALEAGMIVKDKDSNDVILAQTGNYISNIGIITLDSDTITAGFVDTEGLEGDTDVAALIAEMKAELSPLLNEIVANTSVNLNGERAPGNRTEETNLGDLATDALIYVSGADVALTNGGGIRTSLPIDHTNPEDTANYIEGAKAGDITYGDLNAVFPFGNIVITIEITGADLLAALEHGTKSTPEASGGFPQVSGMSFTLHTDRTENRVTDVMIGGEPLDLEKTYILATNDFTQVGGDDYTMLVSCAVTGYYGGLDEALIEYVTDELDGVIGGEYTEPQGRITITQDSYFSDVSVSDWYYSSVNYVYENSIMNGTGEGVFEPNTTMSRAMMVTLLYRVAGSPSPEQSASAYFYDVEDGQWYSDAIAWAYESGVTSGTGETNGGKDAFAPTAVMTREQLVTFLYRYADEQLGVVTAASIEAYWETAEGSFSDFDQINEWAQTAVVYCAANGIVSGMGDGAFNPGGSATRAQAAKIFEVFLTLDEAAESLVPVGAAA